MIKILKKDELHEVSKHMWSVYQDETKRTTPPYHDMKAIEKHLIKIFQRVGDEVIGVFLEGKLKGIAIILSDGKNRYLSVQGPYIQESELYWEIAREIIAYLKSKYEGFKCDFGTTKTNIISQEFLLGMGFKCTDDTIQMSISPDKLNPIQIKHPIQLLTEERREAYRVFHDTQYQDYYWLADRIFSVMNQWKIHVLLEDDKIVGSIFTRGQKGGSGEIFGCEILEPYKNKNVIAELMYKSTKCWMDQGVIEILNFVPEKMYFESASLVGYEGYDTYMCFSKDVL
ncbi:MAG: hypothetical protein JXR88_15235 [Clostridia bacterium]|nr:hypothetical protein [Clostridia bacterium]